MALAPQKQVTPKRPARLIDVARRAGVSLPVVSRILNPNSSHNTRVSEATAKRIRAIAKELNFTPNHSARQLAGQKSQLLAAVIARTAPEVWFRWISLIEQRLEEIGYRLLIGQVDGQVASFEKYIADFASRGVEGVFCMSHSYSGGAAPQIIRAFNRLDHVVYIGRPRWSKQQALPFVRPDTAKGVEQAYRYLHQQGRTRIGLLLFNIRHVTNVQRVRGFQKAALACHNAYDPQRIMVVNPKNLDTPPAVQAQQALDYLVKEQRADAIITTNDRQAVYLIKALKREGLRVPDDVAVVGYDNLDIGELYEPAVTTIDQNSQQLATAAVEVMLGLLREETLTPEQLHRSVEPYLIKRESA